MTDEQFHWLSVEVEKIRKAVVIVKNVALFALFVWLFIGFLAFGGLKL